MFFSFLNGIVEVLSTGSKFNRQRIRISHIIASPTQAHWQRREANYTVATYRVSRNICRNRRRPRRCRRSGRGLTRTRWYSRHKTGHQTLRHTHKDIKIKEKQHSHAQIKTLQFLESCWLVLFSQSATAWHCLLRFFLLLQTEAQFQSFSRFKRLVRHTQTRLTGSFNHV